MKSYIQNILTLTAYLVTPYPLSLLVGAIVSHWHGDKVGMHASMWSLNLFYFLSSAWILFSQSRLKKDIGESLWIVRAKFRIILWFFLIISFAGLTYLSFLQV